MNPPQTTILSNFNPTARWMRRGGREGDVVLSSRVRLARNFRGYCFPHLASADDLLSIRNRILDALEDVGAAAPDELWVLPFEECSTCERQSLIDRHLSSREHIKGETGRALAATSDSTLSILVNEEDHLRVQGLLPGLQFDTAYALVDKIDDAFEHYFDTRGGFAFDAQFGFLTACPTNAGTGLRASAMLHLPALEIAGKLEKTRKWAQNHGFTLRGTFGEGSKVWGHLHQLSNEATLGLDETEILLEMEDATREICERERAAREMLPTQFEIEARDRIGRAFGLLRYARTLSCREATDALSMVRLGHEIGWMKGLSRQKLNQLWVWIRPAYLQVAEGQTIAGAARDTLRADLLRPHIARIKLENEFFN
jgi:protein arginine kinase